MTVHEAIAQLQSLIENSRSFHSEDGDVWERDIEALTVAITALARSEWISVKDRLPENGGYCLVHQYNPRYNMSIIQSGRYSVTRKGWLGAQALCSLDFVTHWMPLPEPPEVSDDE